MAAKSARACWVQRIPSRRELFFHLVLRHELAGIRLPEALFDLRNEAEPLDGILERRMVRERAKGIDGTLLVRDRFHNIHCTIAQLSTAG